MKGLAVVTLVAFTIVGGVLALGCFAQPECAAAWSDLAGAWWAAL